MANHRTTNDKGIVAGLKTLAGGLSAMGQQGVSAGATTGKVVKGTATAGSNLAGAVLKLAGGIMKRFPKISLVVGVFTGVKVLEKTVEGHRSRVAAKQSLEFTADAARRQEPYAPQQTNAPEFSGFVPPVAPESVAAEPVVPPVAREKVAPPLPQESRLADDPDLVRQVMAAMAVADQRRAERDVAPPPRGGAEQGAPVPGSWAQRVGAASSAASRSV